MGLNCINALKLDALKACRRDLSNDEPVLTSSDGLETLLAVSDGVSNGGESNYENGM